MKSVCASDRVSSACFFSYYPSAAEEGPLFRGCIYGTISEKCRNNRTLLYGIPLCTSL